MKKLFNAIRQGDIEAVKALIQRKPELIDCTAKQPPKKDDGQSPLQVAIKSGNFEIAMHVISCGADVNFIEEKSCNAWRAPVLHDAINAAIMCCRWNTNAAAMGGFKVHSTKEKAEEAFHVLETMIQRGANVNALDSFGNSCLNRACLQARQILPSYHHAEHKLSDDRILTDDLREDLSKVFVILIKHGADLSYCAPAMGKPIMEFYADEPILEFLS